VPLVLDLAPSGDVPQWRTAPWPSCVRRLRGGLPVGRPVVDSAEPTGRRPPAVNRCSACVVFASPQVSRERP